MEADDDKTQTHIVLSKGTMIGHYRIVEKIGAGGMGKVYLAEDTKLNRQVALKFLPEYLKSDEDAKSRFKREAQAAASLKHPNIVVIYEVSEFQGRPFFAMECCEGDTLKEMIKKEELPLGRVIKLATQICEGLQEAHEAGIVHRDIKPSNIILDKKSCPKLVDFGLATVKGADKLTRTGSTLGTIGYMSPEQIQVKEIDQRTDLFSLGVVFYELITGRLPFKGDNEASVMNAVLNDVPEPLSRYKSGVPDELQRIVGKLLEKDPALRYQSAADVVSDLKRLTVARPAFKRPADWWNRYVVVGAVLILIIIGGYWLLTRTGGIKSKSNAGKRKMLAVLPFDNLGEAEDEYFADGITEEITSRLGVVEGLGVIARTSAMQYKNTTKDIPTIAKELGVSYILEGSVRWDKSGDQSMVRITPQLIRVADNIHLWADNYERPLTGIFAVQADIATRIVEALDITLLEPERRQIEARPTENMEAYKFFLRGRDYWTRYGYDVTDLDRAISFLEKAVELDTTFAEAYAAISTVRSWCHWIGYDVNHNMLPLAEEAAERAVKYDTLEGYSLGALGALYYWGHQDYPKALEKLYAAQKRLPNNSEVMAMTAYVERRLGHWENSLELQKKAHELSPLHTWILDGIMESTIRMRRWSEAAEYVEKAMEFFPDQAMPYYQKALLILCRDGDYAEAKKVLESAPADIRNSIYIMYIAVECDYYARDYKAALEEVRKRGNQLKTSSDSAFYFYHLADLNQRLNRKDSVKTYYELSLKCVQSMYAEGRVFSVTTAPSIGLIYAGMGLNEEAVKAGLEDLNQLPISKDYLWGAWMMEQMAMIYTKVGEYDKAVALLDTLLSMPSETSLGKLKGDPIWDPLRDNPKFKALLEK